MQTVGDKLREERERRGLAIKDIETATNIRSLYLNAIEQGNYSVLPGEAYVKGFIRNYANALGLNGSEYVELYRKSQSPVSSPEASGEAPGRQVIQPQEDTPALAASQPDTDSSALSKRRNKSRNSELVWILALLVVFAGGGAWWYVSAKDHPQPQSPPIQQSNQSEPARQQPAVPPLPAQQAPAQSDPAKTVQKPVIITAKFTSRSWIQVFADDKEIYEGFPKTGETMTWQANRKIAVKAGNAGGVELTHNGRSLGVLGKNGEVVLKEFMASGQ